MVSNVFVVANPFKKIVSPLDPYQKFCVELMNTIINSYTFLNLGLEFSLINECKDLFLMEVNISKVHDSKFFHL